MFVLGVHLRGRRMFKKLNPFYKASGPVEFVVAGLGNPGREYENTRHNMGFWAVDLLARELGFECKKLKFKSLCGDCMAEGKRVLFLKPSTFMNKSGEAVRDALAFYKIPPQRLLVISDDAALPLGKLRIRKKGSDGGQKGLRSIIYLLGDDEFPRIRVGIGAKAHPDMELADWVLGRVTKDEEKALTPVFADVITATKLIIAGKTDEAMNRFN